MKSTVIRTRYVGLVTGAYVRAYDPVAMQEAKHQLCDGITCSETAENTTQGADALVPITEWMEFRVPDWHKISEPINCKVLFEVRNLYRREILAEIVFDYYGIWV